MSNEKFGSCTSVVSDFRDVVEVHKSGEGAVFLGTFKYDGKRYCLKERRSSELGKKSGSMLHEAKLLNQLNHPNIVKCFGWFSDEGRKSVTIILEYCNAGDLHSLIQDRKALNLPHFYEETIWFLFRQLCDGVRHLHENGIVHRDLKPLNIMLHQSGEHITVKIVDLGVSRQVSKDTIMLNTFYGTPLYLSPELVQSKPYNHTTDLWSMGVILYELCYLRSPFTGRSIVELAQAIVKGDFALPPSDEMNTLYSNSILKCIRSLLKVDYLNRPSTTKLLAFIDFALTSTDSGYKPQSLVLPITPNTTRRVFEDILKKQVIGEQKFEEHLNTSSTESDKEARPKAGPSKSLESEYGLEKRCNDMGDEKERPLIDHSHGNESKTTGVNNENIILRLLRQERAVMQRLLAMKNYLVAKDSGGSEPNTSLHELQTKIEISQKKIDLLLRSKSSESDRDNELLGRLKSIELSAPPTPDANPITGIDRGEGLFVAKRIIVQPEAHVIGPREITARYPVSCNGGTSSRSADYVLNTARSGESRGGLRQTKVNNLFISSTSSDIFHSKPQSSVPTERVVPSFAKMHSKK